MWLHTRNTVFIQYIAMQSKADYDVQLCWVDLADSQSEFRVFAATNIALFVGLGVFLSTGA